MNNLHNSNSLPTYLKLAQIVLGILAFFYIVYLGRVVLVPLLFALIFAILLNPMVNYLSRKNVNRIIAISIPLLLAIIVVGAFLFFIVSQLKIFGHSLPQLQESFSAFFSDIFKWISGTFAISPAKLDRWVTTLKDGTTNNSSVIIGQTLSGVSNMFAFIFLLPVYIFMILFYKPLLLEFIARLFNKEKHTTVAEVLLETKSLIQSYLAGLLLETLIIAILNSAAFLLLGIKYAILLGIIGAILNIIPYLGGLIGLALPTIMALATQNSSTALYVIILYSVIQFIDNNFIVPKIVASKVRMNALISLIVVLFGGALWGIPGMFLSIPMTAIAKVIFDRVDGLKPFGFLIGDNQPELTKIIFHWHRAKVRKPA
jgi:predicted PurR-regulated permease PerM